MKSTAIFGLAALVALAACSGKATTTTTTTDTTTVAASAAPADASAAPAAAANNGDVCSLITQTEAGAAMGETAQPGIKGTDSGDASCRFYNATKSKNVFISVIDPQMLDAYAKMGGKPVDGIGDKAVWTSGSIFFAKGSKALQVGLYLNPASLTTMDASEPALAKAAAGRL